MVLPCWVCCSSSLGEMRMLDGRIGGMMGGFLRGRASAMPEGRARRVLSWWLLFVFELRCLCWRLVLRYA